jgi:hypothetical protein
MFDFLLINVPVQLNLQAENLARVFREGIGAMLTDPVTHMLVSAGDQGQP